MKEYHKIVTAWERDPETKFKTLIRDAWATPEFEYLADADWIWDEKIDGTNIRVMWDEEAVRYGGTTDRAQIPTLLIARLQDLFSAEKMATAFDCPACLYGEGFGAGIQKAGKLYNSRGVDFALFDVRIGDLWLARENVVDIARKLGIRYAPERAVATLRAAVTSLRAAVEADDIPLSSLATGVPIEGYVLRPRIELLDRQGKRVITKIKVKDFR